MLYGAVFGLAVVAQARAQTTPAAGAPPTTEQPTSVSPYRVPLVAFGRAYVFTTQDFLEPLPGKVLILRALHGLASDPRLAAQAQQQVLAAAINKAETSEPTDDRSLLRTFGDSVERLHGLAGGPSVEAIIERALEGMLNGLDGETRILPPSPASDPAGEASAGLALAAGPDGPRVIRAFAWAPAAKAGMRRGDQVLAIDGHATRDLSLQQTMAMLRGPAGSAVSIAVKHEADPNPVTLSLTRSIIRIAAVASHRIGQVAYLHVESFVPGTAKLVRKSFEDLKAQDGAPLGGVVLDLRDNTGGRLDEAVATADELLPPGMPIATTKARRAADEQRFASKVGDVTAGLPMSTARRPHRGGRQRGHRDPAPAIRRPAFDDATDRPRFRTPARAARSAAASRADAFASDRVGHLSPGSTQQRPRGRAVEAGPAASARGGRDVRGFGRTEQDFEVKQACAAIALMSQPP